MRTVACGTAVGMLVTVSVSGAARYVKIAVMENDLIDIKI